MQFSAFNFQYWLHDDLNEDQQWGSLKGELVSCDDAILWVEMKLSLDT